MRILLVEDDKKAARLLVRGLQEEGFAVDVARTAEYADEQAFLVDYALIVLDWMLPHGDGRQLCQRLRQHGLQVPILMLTARDTLADRVTGLDAGADDYLTKPFAFEELLARMRALLRRSEFTREPVLSVGELQLDPAKQQASRAGRQLDLTQKEFIILQILMRRPGSVITRNHLMENVWQDEPVSSDSVLDVHISNLRRKVDAGGAVPLIQTLRGRGYRLAVGVEG